MDAKGAILDLNQIRSLYDKLSTFSFSEQLHCGFDGFNLSALRNFSRTEFVQIIHSLEEIDNKILMPFSFNPDNKFVIHFENDVAEMDCVSFFMIDNCPFFIDIEVKETDDHSQLEEQFENREKSHLPELSFEKNYILIGFDNSGLFKIIYKKDKERQIFTSFEKFLSYINKPIEAYNRVIGSLRDVENILKIQDIKKRIENGTISYYRGTKSAIDIVASHIKDKKIFIIYGNAGTGKTVAALSFFYNLLDSKFLILNKMLYQCLNMYQYYKDGKCFFGSMQFIDSLTNNTVAVIDECQRLTKYELKQIVNKAKKIILLGDNNQAFASGDSLLNEIEIKDYLVSVGINEDEIITYRMKKSARYNFKVNSLLETLHNKKPIKSYVNDVKERVGDEFNISVTMSERKFLSAYRTYIDSSKIYTYFDPTIKEIFIAGEKFGLADKDNYLFSSYVGYHDFIGNTYHAISFDITNCFVYLKNVGLTKRDEKFYLYNRAYNPDLISIDRLEKFSNEINVLFTRGQKSLMIYTDNPEVFCYLNYKIQRGIK